jgi:hypothetical protein
MPIALSANPTRGARFRVGIPDRHNRWVIKAIVPNHHLFWAVKLDDDDAAGKPSTVDRFGLATPDQKAPAPSIGPSRSIGDKERFCKPKVESSILSTGTSEIHSLAYAEFGRRDQRAAGLVQNRKSSAASSVR